jgi:hypothetical protein
MNDRYYEVHITGNLPIMFYNPRLSDPLDPYSRELKKITKKGAQHSEEDHSECSRVEFQGAMHFHDGEDGRPAMGPFIPSEMLEATFAAAATAAKLGKTFKLFVRADDPVGFKLEYKGPRTRDGLWKAGTFVDRRSCGIQNKRVMRTRPIFRNWRCEFTVLVIDSMVDEDQLRNAIEAAGTRGMGSYGKRYGRFEVSHFKDVTRDKKKVA